MFRLVSIIACVLSNELSIIVTTRLDCLEITTRTSGLRFVLDTLKEMTLSGLSTISYTNFSKDDKSLLRLIKACYLTPDIKVLEAQVQSLIRSVEKPESQPGREVFMTESWNGLKAATSVNWQMIQGCLTENGISVLKKNTRSNRITINPLDANNKTVSFYLIDNTKQSVIRGEMLLQQCSAEVPTDITKIFAFDQDKIKVKMSKESKESNALLICADLQLSIPMSYSTPPKEVGEAQLTSCREVFVAEQKGSQGHRAAKSVKYPTKEFTKELKQLYLQSSLNCSITNGKIQLFKQSKMDKTEPETNLTDQEHHAEVDDHENASEEDNRQTTTQTANVEEEESSELDTPTFQTPESILVVHLPEPGVVKDVNKTPEKLHTDQDQKSDEELESRVAETKIKSIEETKVKSEEEPEFKSTDDDFVQTEQDDFDKDRTEPGSEQKIVVNPENDKERFVWDKKCNRFFDNKYSTWLEINEKDGLYYPVVLEESEEQSEDSDKEDFSATDKISAERLCRRRESSVLTSPCVLLEKHQIFQPKTLKSAPRSKSSLKMTKSIDTVVVTQSVPALVTQKSAGALEVSKKPEIQQKKWLIVTMILVFFVACMLILGYWYINLRRRDSLTVYEKTNRIIKPENPPDIAMEETTTQQQDT